MPSAARALLPALLALALPGLAAPASLTVDSTADGLGAGCTLRAAIQAANTDAAVAGCPAGSGADVITVPAGTYTLTLANAGGLDEDANATGDLDVTSSLTIQGAGADVTVIQAGATAGAGVDKVLALNPGCAAGVAVAVSDLTIRHGRNTQLGGRASYGGGVGACGRAASSLALSGVRIADSSNASGLGGGLGVHGMGAAISIEGCTFAANAAGVEGGGGLAAVLDGGTLAVDASTFSANSSAGGGGGVLLLARGGAELQLTGGRVTDNSAGAGGGGLWIEGDSTGQVVLSGLTITGNAEASSGGGGLWIGEGAVTLRYSRIAKNTAFGTGHGTGLFKSAAAGTVSAANNWWGCSTGPGAAPCDTAVISAGAGLLVASPYLRVVTTAAPGALHVGEVSAITATLGLNSDGEDVSANLDPILPLPIEWSAIGGTLSNAVGLGPDGTSTAAYTPTEAGPFNQVSAVLDGDGTDGPNVVSLSVTPAPILSADLGVTIWSVGGAVTPGEGLRLLLAPANAGPDAGSNVVVSVPLPAGVAFEAALDLEDAGWTPAGPAAGESGTVTFTKASVAPGEDPRLAIDVTLDPGLDPEQALEVTATVAASTLDPDPTNDTAAAGVILEPRADLAVTLAAQPDPVTAGQALTLTAALASVGPSHARSVTVTLALPAGTTFVSADADGDGGWAVHAPTAGPVEEVTFAAEVFPAGGAATLTVVTTAGAALADGATLVAQASVTSGTPDPDQADLVASADAAVSNTSGSGEQDAGCGCGASGGDASLLALVVLGFLRRRGRG